MAGLSTYAQQKILDHLLGKAAFAMPTAHIALFTAAPTDAGGGTEANYAGYARKATVAADWNAATAATPSVSSNAQALSFPPCTGGTNNVTHFGVFDAPTGGNLLTWGALSAGLAVSAGITPQFAAGAMTITLD